MRLDHVILLDYCSIIHRSEKWSELKNYTLRSNAR